MAARDAASLLVGLLLVFHTWGAWADVKVNMEDRVKVFRGGTAPITCMFTFDEGVGDVIIQWFYVTQTGEKQKIYYQDSSMNVVDRGTPFTHRISVNGSAAAGQVVLTVTDVQLADELEFICLVKGITVGAAEGRTMLKVFDSPDRPTIEGVQTGISVSENSPSKIGTCEVKNGFPKPNITWYRNNTPLQSAPGVVDIVPSVTTESSGLFSVKSELSMKVVEEDKDDHFYCEISYFIPEGVMMTETNRINVTVFYPSTAVSVWVESPKGKIKEGDSVELRCRGNGNAPSSLMTISRADGENSTDADTLLLKNVSRLTSGVYVCTSMDTDTFEQISGNTTVFVHYLDPAVVMPEDTLVMDRGAELRATCNALSSLQTHTVWLKNGEEVSKGHSLSVKNATYATAGTYMCVVTVPEVEGMKTSGSLVVKVKGPPEILDLARTAVEESFESTVQLSCHVRGFPTPSVTWTTSDGRVLKAAFQQETGEVVESAVSVRVTADVTVFCNASNEFGADAVIFDITATIHTTTPATTTNPSTTTTVSSATVKAETSIPPKKIKKESRGVIIAVIIICILLLAVLGSVLYFLYKKGKLCGRSGKQDLTKEKSNKDNIVVEMKSDNTEEAVLLGVNGEKQPPSDQ